MQLITLMTASPPPSSSKSTFSPTTFSLKTTSGGNYSIDLSRPVVDPSVFSVTTILQTPTIVISIKSSNQLLTKNPSSISLRPSYTKQPTVFPSNINPTIVPTALPATTISLVYPTVDSSTNPTTSLPSKRNPTVKPTKIPRTAKPSIRKPTAAPSTKGPTITPTAPTAMPVTTIPSTFYPTVSTIPTTAVPFKRNPTVKPTKIPPTAKPSIRKPTAAPSNKGPTTAPTAVPVTTIPSTFYPTVDPSINPTTAVPSKRSPTMKPTTRKPTVKPSTITLKPSSGNPINVPSPIPTIIPTSVATIMPSSRGPTEIPSLMTSAVPSSRRPTSFPSKMTTIKPSTKRPTQTPSKKNNAIPPSKRPTQTPSKKTTVKPSTTAPSQKSTIISPADDIQYRGGLVYTGDMKIFNIYYGDFSGNGSQSVGLTNYLAANLGTSSWYDILSSYYGIVNGSRVYVQGSLTLTGSYNLFPKLRKNNTTIPAIKQNIIKYVLNTGIVTPDPTTILAVMFRGDFRVSSGSGSWLVDWCGVHTGLRLKSDDSYYPIFMAGDLSSVSPINQFNCSLDAPFPNNNVAADSLANTYVHEVAEIITDPVLFEGWVFNYDNLECADLCNWSAPNVGLSKVGEKNFSLQSNWQPDTTVKKGNTQHFPQTNSGNIWPMYDQPNDTTYYGFGNVHRYRPTKEPSVTPTYASTMVPLLKPIPTSVLSKPPTSNRPSFAPTKKTAVSCSSPSTYQTSIEPSKNPSTKALSTKPTTRPSIRLPTPIPSKLTTVMPTSRGPTQIPSTLTTTIPSSRKPTKKPTTMPSAVPSSREPTIDPSKMTTIKPSSRRPTQTPSRSSNPTAAPSQKPTIISPADDIQYRGGLVYTGDMKIFNIYYGDFSGNGSQSVGLTNYLAANLGTSSWYDILSSYYGIVNGNRVYVQGSLTFAGSYNLFPKWRGNTTTIPTMKNNVAKYIINKDTSKPYPNNTIFAVIFRGDFTVSSSSGKKWLLDWCGLHNTYKNYPLLFVGDLSSVKADDQYDCSIFAPYPNGNVAADSVASVYAHELVDVITNPTLGQGWTFNPTPDRTPQPWEIGDECSWDQGITKLPGQI
eukprot:gene27006-35712_t